MHASPLDPGSRRSPYLDGALAVAPLAAVIGVVGILFGYVAREAGLSAPAAVLMSATVFAGSAQFAAVAVLDGGGTALAAAGAAALLAARYLAMGAAVAPALGGAPWKRALLAQLAVDESWAVAYRGEGRFSRERLVGAGVLLYAAHVGSTALGTALRGTIPDPAALGLDAAVPTLFLLLLWPHLRRPGGRAAAAAGAAIALALTPVAPPGVPVLAAAAATLVARRAR